jgi:transcriptional regulator with XRE-family HTH domain
MINPDALIIARESRGFSQHQVAIECRVLQGRLSKAEHGLIELSGDEMSRIAEYLHYPISLFSNRHIERMTPICWRSS